jgi:hypothetical protein
MRPATLPPKPVGMTATRDRPGGVARLMALAFTLASPRRSSRSLRQHEAAEVAAHPSDSGWCSSDPFSSACVASRGVMRRPRQGRGRARCSRAKGPCSPVRPDAKADRPTPGFSTCDPPAQRGHPPLPCGQQHAAPTCAEVLREPVDDAPDGPVDTAGSSLYWKCRVCAPQSTYSSAIASETETSASVSTVTPSTTGSTGSHALPS